MARSKGGKPGNPAWVKDGPSPNPGGRPKTTGLIEQYRTDGTADEMLEIMIGIARNEAEDSRVRLAAADKVLDRLQGKPPIRDFNGDVVKDVGITIVRQSARDIAHTPDPTE